jgi:hypothetical protein
MNIIQALFYIKQITLAATRLTIVGHVCGSETPAFMFHNSVNNMTEMCASRN